MGLPVRAEMKGLDLHQAFLDGVEAAFRLAARLLGRIRASLQRLFNGAQHPLDGRGIGPPSDLAHTIIEPINAPEKGFERRRRRLGHRSHVRRHALGERLEGYGLVLPFPIQDRHPVVQTGQFAQHRAQVVRAGELPACPGARSVHSGLGAEREGLEAERRGLGAERSRALEQSRDRSKDVSLEAKGIARQDGAQGIQ